MERGATDKNEMTRKNSPQSQKLIKEETASYEKKNKKKKDYTFPLRKLYQHIPFQNGTTKAKSQHSTRGNVVRDHKLCDLQDYHGVGDWQNAIGYPKNFIKPPMPPWLTGG